MEKLTKKQQISLRKNTKLKEEVRDLLIDGQHTRRDANSRAILQAPKGTDGYPNKEDAGYSDLVAINKDMIDFTKFSNYYFDALDDKKTKALLVRSLDNFEYESGVLDLMEDKLTDFVLQSEYTDGNGKTERIIDRIIRQAYFEDTVRTLVLKMPETA